MRWPRTLVIAASAAAVSAPPGLAAARPARTASDYCTVAYRLADVDPAAARAALAKALHLDVGARCPRARAKLTAPAPPPPKWHMKWIEDEAAAWSKVAGAAAGGLLLALAVIGLLTAAATYWRPVRSFLRVLPGVGGVFQPRVAVGDLDDAAFDGKYAKPTAALIGLALRRLEVGGESGAARVDVTTGAEGLGATITRLGDVAGQFKALGAIVEVVSRAAALPRYKLGGALEPDGGRGPGVTLALDRRSRSAGATVLWRDGGTTDKQLAASFEFLALVAAGWAEWAIRTDERLGELEYPVTPRSYAYLRAGSVFEYLAEPGLAQLAYEHALQEDGTNAGALANLGRLRDRENDSDGAEVLLEAAFLALGPVPDG